MKKAFTMLELLLVLIVSSIMINLIYSSFFELQKNNIKLNAIKSITNIKESLEDSLKNNNILIGTLINENKIMINDLEGNEIPIYNKNEWNQIINNQDRNIILARIKFLNGIQPSNDKIYIYPMKKYIRNNINVIPYIDYYILTLPNYLDKVYKATEEITVQGILFPETTFQENISELVEITSSGVILKKYYINGEYNTLYPILLNKNVGERTFKKLREGIYLAKISTKDIVFNKYLESIELVNKIGKRLQDWGSIIQAERDTKAEEGDSYNLDVFRTIGTSVESSDIDFNRGMIFSGSYFDNYKNNQSSGLRDLTSTSLNGPGEGFFNIPLLDIYSTDYGIVFCKVKCQENDLTNKLDNENIIDLEILESEDTSYYYNNNPDVEIDDYNDILLYGINQDYTLYITKSMPIDSDYLLPGSKKILGLDTLNVQNSFGQNYKILISTAEEIIIQNESGLLRIDNRDTNRYTFKQKIPKIDYIEYAPFGIIIYTPFPWSNYTTYDDDLNNDSNNDGITGIENKVHGEDGIYYKKIYPELR